MNNDKMDIDEEASNSDYCTEYSKDQLKNHLGNLVKQFDLNKINILRRKLRITMSSYFP